MNFDFPYPSRRVPVMARNIVSTSQPLAAQAGLSMLQQGGNAVDAALAAAMTLTVVEPTGNGLGSDAFAILWDGKQLHGLNASGRSPEGWTRERFAKFDTMPQRGWESVTVPGAVSSWVALSERFGKLPFEKLFEPAIRYARYGYAVSPTIAVLWKMGAKTLAEQPGFRDCFMPKGRAPEAGELFVNTALADSLEAIAVSRGEAFYRGALARKIAAAAAENGAAMTAADLDKHTVDWSGVISMRFKGYELHEIPPNGQGIAALMALGILENTEIADLPPDSPQSLHLQIEAMKLAFADTHRYVGDLDHMQLRPSDLLSPGYLAERAKLIDRSKASVAPVGAPTNGGTVYITAADQNGMMVSFIQSNYAGFGSGVVVPGTGIHLQNRGSGFSLKEGHPNVVAPRKRPFHTIIPAFLTRQGEPVMSFGVMGGPMQAQGHVQMVIRTQLHGQNPQTASDAPRWRYIQGKSVAMETAMPAGTVSALETMGHEITLESPDNAFGFGGAQLIQKTESGYVAGSDHRKDGCAAGF
ncbi:gamma-glutamyltransferase family protein [Rhizobium binxianense]